MNRSRSSWLCVLAIAIFATTGVARAQDAAQDAAQDDGPSIDALSFMAGCWLAEQGGDRLQECWTGPAGNSMLGGFRWMKGDNLWMSEHLTIVDEGDAIVFRLRHFSDKGVAWEEKDEPITAKLMSLDGKKATFDDVTVDGRQFIFDGTTDGQFGVTLVGKDKQGKRTERTFSFKRMEM